MKPIHRFPPLGTLFLLALRCPRAPRRADADAGRQAQTGGAVRGRRPAAAAGHGLPRPARARRLRPLPRPRRGLRAPTTGTPSPSPPPATPPCSPAPIRTAAASSATSGWTPPPADGVLHRRHAASYIGHKTNALDGTSPRTSRRRPWATCCAASTAFQGDRHLGQGPRRHPAGGQGRHGLHVHGRQRAVRLEHLLHEAAPGVGERLQRRQAGGPVLQDRMEAAAGRCRVRPLAAGQPALVRPARRQAADADGHRCRQARAPVLRALLRSPFADALTLDFARAAIAANGSVPTTRPTSCRSASPRHDYVSHP